MRIPLLPFWRDWSVFTVSVGKTSDFSQSTNTHTRAHTHTLFLPLSFPPLPFPAPSLDSMVLLPHYSKSRQQIISAPLGKIVEEGWDGLWCRVEVVHLTRGVFRLLHDKHVWLITHVDGYTYVYKCTWTWNCKYTECSSACKYERVLGPRVTINEGWKCTFLIL